MCYIVEPDTTYIGEDPGVTIQPYGRFNKESVRTSRPQVEC